MHTTAGDRQGGQHAPACPVLAEQHEDQAGQQQRGDGHAGDRVGRRADLAGQPRRHGDEQEAEHEDHQRAEDALRASSPARAAAPRARTTTRPRLPKMTTVIGRSRSVRDGRRRRRRWPAQVAQAGDDRADDQRQGPAHADDAAGRHRPGADVAQVVACRCRPGSMLRIRPLSLPSSSSMRLGRRHRRGQVLAERGDQRPDDEERQHGAGHHQAGDPRADQVADAEQLRRQLAADRRALEADLLAAVVVGVEVLRRLARARA